MIFASLVGLAFLAAGAAAYSGAWKGWITARRGYGSTMGFAWLWMGAAFCTGSLASAVSFASRPVFFALCAVAAALLVVALVAFFWLPRVLLPRWYRELRGESAPPRGREGPRR